MLSRKHANGVWLDIKFKKVLWWKEAALEVKHTPGSVSLFGAGHAVWMYQEKS